MGKKKRRSERGAKAASAPVEKEPESTDVPPVSSGDDEAPAASARAPEDAAAPAPPKPGAVEVHEPGKRGAAWADPIAAFEKRWTAFESQLITYVLVTEVLVLVAWVLLSGLASPLNAEKSAGTVFRGVVGAVALGIAAFFAMKRRGITSGPRQAVGILGAIAVGIAVAPAWRSIGVGYFGNWMGWLQEGSTLTLMGGLRGVATRLTLWIALLGASLATAAGKHIHIDVIFRFLPRSLRLPAAVVNFLAAALVCFAATWGFFDHIAIESYGAKADAAAGEKIARAAHEMGEHAFLTRKQIGLDLRTFPRVLVGSRYDGWMSAGDWNAWVLSGDFEERYGKDATRTILAPVDSPVHPPIVTSPAGTSTRGMLTHDLSLVFPFGFMILGIRFLLRALLALSGHLEIDPDAAHKEEIRGATPIKDEDEPDPSGAAGGGA